MREKKGKLSLYCCRVLEVSREGFYQYLARKDRPWKYQDLADAMWAIHNEDPYNLGIGVQKQYIFPPPGQADAQVYGGGGFAYAPFLMGDGDDFGHGGFLL